jgi:aspartate aminotransferase-like enzyme
LTNLIPRLFKGFFTIQPIEKLTSDNRDMSYKLFIPGPVEVSAKTFGAMTQPVFGHRSAEFSQLYFGVQTGLQELFETKDPVFLSTSSSWGVMEAAVRNLTGKGVLNCMNGAFSDRWHDVALKCGKTAGSIQFPWGSPVDPDAVRKELATGRYDLITMVHNETSTGTMSPLAEIMEVVRDFPEVLSVVDTVSSFSAVAVGKDRLGIDVVLTGSQKALALPPGLAIFSVSNRALQRAGNIKDRGFYFDFLEFQKNHEKGMTPTTPNISLIFALRSKLEDIREEGIERRYARHASLNRMVHHWVEENGFRLFPEKAFASRTLSCVENTREVDVPSWIARIREYCNCVIDGGYGKLKGRTFRISNMGDETEESISSLLKNLTATLDDR